jgi:hypothetical protein
MKASPLDCPPFDDLGGLWLCRNPVVLNKLGVFGMFPMNRDLDHNFAASPGLKMFRGDVSGLISDLTPLSYIFLRRLRCAEGVPFRPADLTRRYSSQPPEVPGEMALVRKTSRLGNFRQRSMCVPKHVFHMFQAPPQQIR